MVLLCSSQFFRLIEHILGTKPLLISMKLHMRLKHGGGKTSKSKTKTYSCHAHLSCPYEIKVTETSMDQYVLSEKLTHSATPSNIVNFYGSLIPYLQCSNQSVSNLQKDLLLGTY